MNSAIISGNALRCSSTSWVSIDPGIHRLKPLQYSASLKRHCIAWGPAVLTTIAPESIVSSVPLALPERCRTFEPMLHSHEFSLAASRSRTLGLREGRIPGGVEPDAVKLRGSRKKMLIERNLPSSDRAP